MNTYEVITKGLVYTRYVVNAESTKEAGGGIRQ